MERQWWPEKPLISGWSEIQYVAEAAVFLGNSIRCNARARLPWEDCGNKIGFFASGSALHDIVIFKLIFPKI